MGLFGSTSAAQRPLSRSIGNAQARNPALPGMPAYGNTTNVNGAQTAVQSPMVAQSPQIFGAVRQTEQNQLQSMPTTPAPAPYPGGDVPGLASFYRNKATQAYMPPSPQIAPDAAGNSAQAARIAGSLPVGPNGITSAPGEIAQFNGYDGNTQAFNNPTRLTPTQREFIARQSAQTAGQTDPTGLGQRFGAGSALGQQAAAIAAGQAGVAAGNQIAMSGGYGNMPSYIPVNQQAEQQRLASLAASSPERALNQNSTGTQFAYPGKNGEIVSTNRLGMLQQMDRSSIVKDPAVQAAIELQKQKNAELAYRHEDRRAFTRAENGGLTGRQKNRLETKERVMRRAVKDGIIDQSTMDQRLAGINKDFQTNNKWGDIRRGQGPGDAMAGIRLPNGQLPKGEAKKSAETVVKLTDPNYRGSDPKQNLHAEAIQSIGLTADMAAPDAMKKVLETPIPQNPDERRLYLESLKSYWKAKRGTDSNWSATKAPDGNPYPMGHPMNDPTLEMLNRLSETPDDKLDQWLEEWQMYLDPNQIATSGFPKPW